MICDAAALSGARPDNRALHSGSVSHQFFRISTTLGPDIGYVEAVVQGSMDAAGSTLHGALLLTPNIGSIPVSACRKRAILESLEQSNSLQNYGFIYHSWTSLQQNYYQGFLRCTDCPFTGPLSVKYALKRQKLVQQRWQTMLDTMQTTIRPLLRASCFRIFRLDLF